MSGLQQGAMRPALSSPRETEQTINRLKLNMQEIKRLAISRYQDDCDQFLSMIPDYFKELAEGFQRCMQTPSWDVHEAFTPLLKGNMELISSIDSSVQDTVIEHYLKHFPLALRLVADIRHPSPLTTERMARSLVEQLPLLIAKDTDLAQYYNFMRESFSVQAFTQVSAKLFSLIHENINDPNNAEDAPVGALAQAASMTNTLLGYHGLSGNAEIRNNPPADLLLLLVEHQDMIINIRQKNVAIGLMDMELIEMLYASGLAPLADQLCKEWILTYAGTGLINDLQFHGLNKPSTWFDDLRNLQPQNPKLPYIYELNLLEQSLINENFKVEFVAEHFMVNPLDGLFETLINYGGKGKEDPLECPDQLTRIGKLIDQICTLNRVAARQLPRLLADSVYWRHSEFLSESQLEKDLGL